MQRFALQNRSGYDTEDLRRFIARGLRACGVQSRRPIRVIVTAAPERSRGCADVGRCSGSRCVTGQEMSIAIASPSNFTLQRFARLFMHEAAHLRGLEHEDMPEKLLYSIGDVPEWARGAKIRYRGRAQKQLPLLGDGEQPAAGTRPDRDRVRISRNVVSRDRDPERRPRRGASRKYYVYVVELRGPRPSVYVGSSALTPAERFRKHRTTGSPGHRTRGSHHVRRHGVRLLPGFYQHLNPFHSRQAAQKAERALAERLHRRGYTVHGACSPTKDRDCWL